MTRASRPATGTSPSSPRPAIGLEKNKRSFHALPSARFQRNGFLAPFGLALLASFWPCFADGQKQATYPPGDVFWEVRQRQEAGAAAQLVLATDPVAATLLREAGFRWKVWREPEFLASTAPALSSRWLDELRDGTRRPTCPAKPTMKFAKTSGVCQRFLARPLFSPMRRRRTPSPRARQRMRM